MSPIIATHTSSNKNKLNDNDNDNDSDKSREIIQYQAESIDDISIKHQYVRHHLMFWTLNYIRWVYMYVCMITLWIQKYK